MAAGYVGAGTAEFLLSDDGSFAFLEINARLQVEHPVTEAGHRASTWSPTSSRIAAGEPLWLGQAEVGVTGHAIEARLYAEDPWQGFLPAAGHVLAVHWPEGPGVRIDAGIGQGDEIGTRYDPLLAKLIAVGADRPAALTRMTEALAATRIIGLTTNRGVTVGALRGARSRRGRCSDRHHRDPMAPGSRTARGDLDRCRLSTPCPRG